MFSFKKKKNDEFKNFEIPKFKYIENNEEVFSFDPEGVNCQCCGKLTHIVYENNFYSTAEIEEICPDCIANGMASEKFNGTFNDAELVDSIDNDKAKEELEKRTPSLNTWQDVRWASCCNDYCTFIKFMTIADFKNKEMIHSIRETYDEDDEGVPFKELKSFVKHSDGNLLLFKCNTCHKYYIFVDFD